MAIKMYDSDLWDKEWFQNYSLLQKSLFLFLFGKCDCAGIYEPSKNMLRLYFGKNIKMEDFESLNQEKEQVKILPNGKIFILDYIFFQQKLKSLDDLNPKFSVHRGIISRLNKNNVFETLAQPLSNPYPRVQDKDMVIVKVKDNTLSKQVDIYCSPEIEKIFTIYSEICTDLCKLTFERKNREIREKIGEYLKATDYKLEYFKNVCIKANKLKVIAENNIDLKSILNNYIGIMNGKYEKKEEETTAREEDYTL